MKNPVMLEQRRNDEHVVELHVERPVGDALFGREQHPDDQSVVAGNPLRAHADVESTDAEREVADADMGQRSAQPPAAELHHIDMRAMDGLLKSFETVQLARINQKELPHGCTLLLKRDNSAAARRRDHHNAKGLLHSRSIFGNL